MPHHIRVRHGRVKIDNTKKVGNMNTKTAGKLSLKGYGMEPETNLSKLKHSLRALSISGKKPKYISF